MRAGRVSYTVALPKAVSAQLDHQSDVEMLSNGVVLRKAIALLDFQLTAAAEGHRLMIVSADGKTRKEIVPL